MNTLHFEILIQTAEELIVGDTRWNHRNSDGFMMSGTTIYWNDDFNPMTQNFHSTLINALTERVEGFELISEDEDLTTFMLDEFEITLEYTTNSDCDETYFTFTLVGFPNDTPLLDDENNTGMLVWSSDEDDGDGGYGDEVA